MTKNLLRTIKEIDYWRKFSNSEIHFVPTMGNLHQGHQRLIEEASRYKNKSTLVSIFINPLQFNNKKDFNSYPKTIKKDIEIAFSSGADAIFIPKNNEIFPENEVNIKLIEASKHLTSNLCGATREGHFNGVCTVVHRLLNIIKPSIIFLGEKDWQQLLVLKEMIKKLNMNIKVKSIATKRDIDNVPFSSRNNLLSEKERKQMQLFSSELLRIQNNFSLSNRIDLKKIIKKLKLNEIEIEYIEYLNAFDLQKSNDQEGIKILAGAVLCGNTRLIDHVFLMKKNPIIAIDGPAGSGKSTITKLVAKKLNFIYLDTGAMYRALSWFFLKEKINYINNSELDKYLETISIFFKSNPFDNSKQEVFINNYCVTEEIRTQEITSIVSSIASIKEVRKFLVNEQRKIGESGGLIAEGRDIGSKVFPNAEIKLFLNASIDERARRRKIDLENSGYKNISFNEVKDQIIKRDLSDKSREISPLIKAKDAIEISTDGRSIKEITSIILDIYDERIPKEIQENNS